MSSFKKLKDRLNCNRPTKSPNPDKKRVVKACQDGEERLIHFGASDYKSNYSDEARKNFRARHNCSEAKYKLSARYCACKNLWSPDSTVFNSKKKK